jgi:hypothetical protein
MKLFKNNQIKKQALNSIQGGANGEDCRTKGCVGTLEWCGYGIGWRADEEERCDEVVSQQ